MPTQLRAWLVLCWNAALIFLLAVLTVVPLWSFAFTIVCCLATVWPVYLVYDIFATRSSRNRLDRAAPPDQTGADFMKEAA
ncbi:MAG TPA: hypothetical protein VGJ20_44155 [Xanthobacteraceae bacterium]|jgi:hypothetical protein